MSFRLYKDYNDLYQYFNNILSEIKSDSSESSDLSDNFIDEEDFYEDGF